MGHVVTLHIAEEYLAMVTTDREDLEKRLSEVDKELGKVSIGLSMAPQEGETDVVLLSPVESSNISHVGYSSKTDTIVVVFSNGGLYGYRSKEDEDVDTIIPLLDAIALLNAKSVGKHFAKEIKPKAECVNYFS